MDRHPLQLCPATVIALVLATSISIATPPTLHAHGTPAKVGVVDGRLTFTGNLATPSGYVPQVHAETDPDSVVVPIAGNRLYTDFPGFEISGLAPGSGLTLQPFSVPYLTPDGPVDRMLWYWSPLDEAVAIAPDDPQLTLLSARGLGETTLPQFASEAGSVTFMEPLASDLGQHRHPLYYLLSNSPAAATGAYGFFARLTSPSYEASAPFLIVLNHGLSAAQLSEAALAINAAPLPLAGDYNLDGVVDAADYTVWRNHLGTTGLAPYSPGDGNGDGMVDELDYQIWKDEFGGKVPPSLHVAPTPVPEPSGLSSWALAMLLLLVARWRSAT